MRYLWSIWVVFALALFAQAQITETATFENYAPNTFFKPSFIDTLSKITFLASTNPLGGFAIDSDSLDLFDGSNYLTAAVGSNGFGGNFGFTGDLPEPSNRVSADAIYFNSNSNNNVTLEGFNSSGTLIAQQSFNSPGIFTLEISSSQYDITTFQIVVNGGFEGYDNISYTYLPEPSVAMSLLIFAAIPIRRRK